MGQRAYWKQIVDELDEATLRELAIAALPLLDMLGNVGPRAAKALHDAVSTVPVGKLPMITGTVNSENSSPIFG